ncbi:hypothetical protein QVD17_40235 [Tagetes erecta]|uniref:Integrase catalytic domain-containing protein n=1 Tax=Tagetes erecta TaxID=13708 RepID=A0AAD8NHR3_TARER|nr:hypothetical protein QVD17_40235 [Tagetes erecta]
MSSDSSTVSSTISSTVSHIPIAPTLTLVNFPPSLKLNATNYLGWKTQIEALLHGLDLYKYIDGSYPSPKPTVNAEGVATPHEEYPKWFRQDRLLFGALVGSLSPTIVSLIRNATSSHEAWKILSNTYASPSRGHIKQLQYRLKQLSKTTDQSITEYMQSVKTLVDELNILGKSMDTEDITDIVINGLDQKSYKPIIEAIHARDTAISFHELHEKLINHELSIIQTPNPTTNLHQPITAFAAHTRPTSKPWTNRSHNNTPGLLPTPQTHNPPRPFLGKCQWCFLKGHSLSSCPTFKKQNPQISLPTYSRNNNQPQAHMMYTGNTTPTPPWLFDSGASHHITNDLNALSLHAPYDGNEELIIGDGSSLTITHIGSINLTFSNTSITLKNVLCVPSISRNIISISRLCIDNNILIEFFHFNFVIKDYRSRLPLLRGTASRGIYELRPSSLLPQAFHLQLNKASFWHHRLGHPHFKVLQHLASTVSSISSFQNHCNSCCINKSHKLPFSVSSITSNAPLQILFSDVWSSPITSFDGFKYYIIFVDHFTKYIWIYPLKRKSDSLDTFTRFQRLVENHFKSKIRTLFSDNGGEYIKLSSHLSSCGISHLTSPPHTPEHNGYAERRHRHIVETGLSLLSHAKLPIKFWTFAFTTATYLINRLPTITLQNDSPFYRLFHQLPNYDKLRSFGCLSYPWLRPYTNHKLQSRSKPCIFVGYSSSQSAYYLLDPLTNRIYTSRHVHFVENIFPYENIIQTTTPPTPSPDQLLPFSVQFLSSDTVATPTNTTTSYPANTSPTHSSSNSIASVLTLTPLNTSDNISTYQSPPTSSNATPSTTSSTPTDSTPPPMSTRTTRKPNPKYHNKDFLLYTTTTQPITEPSNITQALKQPQWRKAMQDEFDALQRNNTWTLVPSTSAPNLVGCKWVFRTKFKPDGSFDRFKARLVAKGFHQRPGLDYVETFSPVVKPATIRLILSLATSHNWCLRQLDINNAFLQGNLTESVYMSQPPGFADPSLPTHVCKLNKAIYGLRQASRAWYDELKKFLLSYNFTPTISDPSLFIQKHTPSPIYIIVYVDDIIITGPNSTLVETFINSLANRFSLKDLGTLSYFLGVEVIPHTDGLFLSQGKYILDLLNRANMSDSKPVTTPMSTSEPPTKLDGTPLPSPTDYRAFVGALQYLSLTRPDVAFTVNKLSQFMHSPTNIHWSALKRLLRYLHGTMHHGLLIRRHSPLNLHAFTDADWAGDKLTYRSTTGYIVYLGSNPISWGSKRQPTLARSSTEAEFRAVASTTTEVQWIISLLQELGYQSTVTPAIYCDNLSATHYSANPVFHSRMKHLALDFHFVREKVKDGTVRVTHISGDDQLADALTKPLPKPRHLNLMSKIGLLSKSSILRGNIKSQSVQS